MSRKGKFATLVEILIDLILKALYKANKNKKVKVKSPDTEEKDETTQTTKVVDLSKIYIFCKRIMLPTAADFELRIFYYIFSLCSECTQPHALPRLGRAHSWCMVPSYC